MNDETISRLLRSIHSDNLIIFCGAGLSMAPPSNVPSAAELTDKCIQRDKNNTGKSLPDQATKDLESMAKYFLDEDQFYKYFLSNLIQWEDFKGAPNAGHLAIVDFLYTGAFEFAVSTNPDILIENAASSIGALDFTPVVLKEEIYKSQENHGKLIKIHGCCNRDPKNTLWCKHQLTDGEPLKERIDTFRAWLESAIPEKDILIVGFWSDWRYLNETLYQCLGDIEPQSVYLVDPESLENLKEKAPELSEWANGRNVRFEHIRESGADTLEELRLAFSEIFLNDIFQMGLNAYKAYTETPYEKETNLPPNVTVDSLFKLRQDYCGVPRNKFPRMKKPDEYKELIGGLHLLLLEKGAILSDSKYSLQDKVYRLIFSSGMLLSSVKIKYQDESAPPGMPITMVAVKAEDNLLAVGNIIRGERKENIIDQAPSTEWITEEKLLKIIGV